MTKSIEQDGSANHYETFVVRLWVEHGSEVRHGEVRHLTSGAAHRFREVSDALAFIERTASRHGAVQTPANKPRSLK
jgi:hypothetical protein